MPFSEGRDGPRIALEHHRLPQMTKECFKMHFSRNSLLTFRNSQVAKHSDFFCSKLGIKWILRRGNGVSHAMLDIYVLFARGLPDAFVSQPTQLPHSYTHTRS